MCLALQARHVHGDQVSLRVKNKNTHTQKAITWMKGFMQRRSQMEIT